MTSISSSMVSSWASNLFSKLDTNKQGYLQKSDLENAFSSISSSSSSSSSSSTSSVDDLFTQLDSDSDGKVTKDELTTALQQVADQLDSQFNSMRMGQGGGMPPPPPGGEGGMNGAGGMPPAPPQNDTGFTKDELTSQLEDIGSSDSQRSEFITNVVNNFDQADTDGDGKVTFKEAQALNQSLNSSSTTSTTTASSSSDSSSSSSSSSDDQVLSQIMQLMQAYQVFGGGNDDRQFGLASLLSTSA